MHSICASDATAAFARLHDASERGDVRAVLAALRELFEVFPPALDYFVAVTSSSKRTITAAVEHGGVRAFEPDVEPDGEDECWSPVDEREGVDVLLERAERVEGLLESLVELERAHPREARIVRRCYGIDVAQERQLDVAADMGVSNERVRQLRRAGQRRLRALLEGRERSRKAEPILRGRAS